MEVTKRVFEASRKGQKLAANIYIPTALAQRGQRGRPLTLLLAHANGFHKELWEPTLQRLFAHQSDDWYVDRAIALDGYNHGDSAVINRESVKDESFSPWFENARDILSVVRQLGGPRNIVGVGHSWGASSLLIAEIISPLTFVSLIITDPVLFPKVARNDELREITLKRRSEWDDAESARAYFEPHAFFKTWDKRVLDLHIKHGLEAVEAKDRSKLVLKCRPNNEAAVYMGALYASSFATHNLWRVRCPVAFLTGELSQPSPPEYIAKITKPMVDCRHVIMKGAGHLLIHEDPTQTADIYIGFLYGFAPKIAVPARL
ncbi:alpha/beta-hydrolase [Martensiomyces pterosporus]|nr:alpha/beta-hydrolase [Martensiomyces pterosporus]